MLIFFFFLVGFFLAKTHFCIFRTFENEEDQALNNRCKSFFRDSNFSVIISIHFNDFIRNYSNKEIELALFDFTNENPLNFNLDQMNIESFSFFGSDDCQFIHFDSFTKTNRINLSSFKTTLMFDNNDLSFSTLELEKSILLSSNGKIELFAEYLITDSESLRPASFSSIRCRKYNITSKTPPSVDINVVGQSKKRLNNDIYSDEIEEVYCLCLVSRYDYCKSNRECDYFAIPIENYITGKEDWFLDKVSTSQNKVFSLYATRTENSYLNIGFDDFVGENNTIRFISADTNSPVSIILNGKYISRDPSQKNIFNVEFTNIDQVTINSDVAYHLNRVSLKRSPLFIKIASDIYLNSLYSDSESLTSFEGNLHIQSFISLNQTKPRTLSGTIILEEGCTIYIPQASSFPALFVNDESFILCDQNQDNDMIFYFAEFTDPTKKWTIFLSDDYYDHTLTEYYISLKTSNETNTPMLFSFNLLYIGFSLQIDDISKLSSSMKFEIIVPNLNSEYSKSANDFKNNDSSLELNSNNYVTLILDFDYISYPTNYPFNSIPENINLILKSPKTVSYFLSNINSHECIKEKLNDTDSFLNNPECKKIDVSSLASLTLNYSSFLSKVLFNDEKALLTSDDFEFELSELVASTISIAVNITNELILSIDEYISQFPTLNFAISNSGSNIVFDESFDSMPIEDISKQLKFWHENLDVNFISKEKKTLPNFGISDNIIGVLYDTSTISSFSINKTTNFDDYTFRTGPIINIEITEEGTVIPQSKFLAQNVNFKGLPFYFNYEKKSRCSYLIENPITFLYYSDLNYSNQLSFESLEFRSKGKIQHDILHPINMTVNRIICNVRSIEESNFDSAILVNHSLNIRDKNISRVIIGTNEIQIYSSSVRSARLQKGSSSTHFNVFVDNTLDQQVTLSVDENSTIHEIDPYKKNILSNLTIFFSNPCKIFIDKSWYNVTNPHGVEISSFSPLDIEIELLSIPGINFVNHEIYNFKLKEPKHSSGLAFFLFEGLSSTLFIICISFISLDCAKKNQPQPLNNSKDIFIEDAYLSSDICF